MLSMTMGFLVLYRPHLEEVTKKMGPNENNAEEKKQHMQCGLAKKTSWIETVVWCGVVIETCFSQPSNCVCDFGELIKSSSLSHM